jgi:large conductance mechanosensitive channel
MFKDFKTFAFKGNLIDLAVAVVIGGAFGKIVTSLVSDIIMPLIGLVAGRVDLTTLYVGSGDAKVMYGSFLQACLDFLIIAFCIFLAIRLATKTGLIPKKEEPKAPEGPTEAELLTEIRDLLKERQ